MTSCNMGRFLPGAERLVAAGEVGGEIGEGDRGEALEQKGFRVGEGAVERGVDRLLDEAGGMRVAIADGEGRRLAAAGPAEMRAPPAWPRSAATSPASRRRPSVRRTTTGLVPRHFARASEVVGRSCSAMCRSAWRTEERRLSSFM